MNTIDGQNADMSEKGRDAVREGGAMSDMADGADGATNAISKELSAAQDSVTCKWTLADKWPNSEGNDHVFGYVTECGYRHTWWPDSLPNFCPTCGRKVKR